MKVFENIDKYDLFPTYQLSEEEDEKFAADLKQIVTDLIPIRHLGRKTRQYFSSHLCLDHNIAEHKALHTKYTSGGQSCPEYQPKPGEYKWSSDMLQPALIAVLDDDKYSFGYIVNLLNFDLADRRGPNRWSWREISESMIEFSLKFDYDEIKAKVDSMTSYKEKRDYLNKINLACETFGKLNQDEYDELGRAFEYKLDKLIDAIEKEQEIWGEEKPKVTHPEVSISNNRKPPVRHVL